MGYFFTKFNKIIERTGIKKCKFDMIEAILDIKDCENDICLYQQDFVLKIMLGIK